MKPAEEHKPSKLELMNALNSAANEIQELRRRVEVLQGIADTVTAFRQALNAEAPRHGMCEDIVWQLRQMAEKCAPVEVTDKTKV